MLKQLSAGHNGKGKSAFRAAVSVMAVALALSATPARAETTLVLGGSNPVGDNTIHLANQRFTDTVNKRAAGRLKINFVQGEQLGNDTQVIEQMMQGSVHVYGDVLGWYANWVKDLAILNWGFTFDNNDHMQKFLDSAVFESLSEQLRKNQGLRILASGPTEPRVLFSQKVVNTPADLQGLKMRVPGIRTYQLLWQTLETRPTQVAWAEVFLGLKTGVIEAAEGPVSAAYAQKFHQGASNVMRTNHVVSTYQISINDAAFRALDSDLQKILQEAAADAVAFARQRAEQEVDAFYEKMRGEGANIVSVNAAPFAEKAVAGVKEMEADGEWSAGLWQSIRDLR